MYDKIYIGSIGGLGNRLKNIVSGLILSEQTGKPLAVSWVVNSHLLCEYQDIFQSPDIQLIPQDERTIFDERISIPRQHDSHLLMGNEIITMHNITEHQKAVFIRQFLKFKPVQDIIDKIQFYVDKYQMDKKNTIGIHYRYDNEWTTCRGDITAKIKEGKNFADDFIEKIQLYDKDTTQFFICAANIDCINLFSKIDNMFYISKTTNSNVDPKKVNRTKEAVVDAVIDLYLLSRCSEILITPASTFSECAWYMGGCKAKVFNPVSRQYLN